MISVIIPTLNAEAGLAATLASLVPAAVSGLVREVIIVDGGSSDATHKIAEDAGAVVLFSAPGRGQQLGQGAAIARSDWLLFLHADTLLQLGWEQEVRGFMERVENGARPPSAAAFRFVLDDQGLGPRILEKLVHWRCQTLRWPYGDQGLLLPRRLYDQVGGYAPMPLMEDLDLVHRLGRHRIVMLRTPAITSAVRYKRGGYLRRTLRNLCCLTLYHLKVPPRIIARLYE